MEPPQAIYLNHAGTSWPKPTVVLEAASAVWSSDPASWPEVFEDAHQTVADFFHVKPPRLLLTPSCTAALNLAVMDHAWKPGDRIVTSGYEHHALHRTLVKLQRQGVETHVLPSRKDELIDLEALRSQLVSGRVRLLALTAACNVTGQLMPVAGAIQLAHEHDTLALIDGAQIAGWWDLDLERLGADLFCFAGHKGPHAPWGIGGLYVSARLAMACPQATCQWEETSASSYAPMPGYCDAGSVNLAALAGLAAACRWLCDPGQGSRLEHARALAQEFADLVRRLPGVNLQGDVASDKKVPTVAMSVASRSVNDVAARLRDEGVIASAGFQCAPLAHKSLGTDRTGVLRFSFGPNNQASEVARAAEILKSVF